MNRTTRTCAALLGAASLLASFTATACVDQAAANSVAKKPGLAPSVAGSATAAFQAPMGAPIQAERAGRVADRRAPDAVTQNPSPQPKDGTVLALYHAW